MKQPNIAPEPSEARDSEPDVMKLESALPRLSALAIVRRPIMLARSAVERVIAEPTRWFSKDPRSHSSEKTLLSIGSNNWLHVGVEFQEAGARPQ